MYPSEREREREMAHNESRLLRKRRAEEADYWRKRSGWFDDDASMKDYNNGVYDTYYQLDDEASAKNGNVSGFSSDDNSEMIKLGLKVGSVLMALGLCGLMYRAISRRLTGEKSSSKDKKRSGSRSRDRDRRSSRSRTRKGDGEYDLMDEDDASDGRSRRSSRSKSKGRSRSKGRSSSRARSRSRSKARRASAAASQVDLEPVLV